MKATAKKRTRVSRRGRRLPVDERRAQLVELGVRLFSERPYDAISTDDIAREADISKGLLYHYFGSKHGFYVEAVREMARQLVAVTTPDPALPSEEAFRGALEGLLRFLEEKAELYRGLMRGGVGVDPEALAVVQWARERTLEHILAHLHLPQPGPRLRVLLNGWLGFTEAACLNWLDHRDLTRAEMLDVLVASFDGVLRDLTTQATAPGAAGGFHSEREKKE